MLQEHAKIVDFISLAEGITGRKKLQKMIYILKKMGVPFQEKYEFHIYGPYSEELTARVEELCDMGFVSEELEDKGSYVQYKYSVTAEGMEFSNALGKSVLGNPSQAVKLNEKSGRFLELTATLLYFDHLERAEQIEKLHVVKGKLNFTNEEINQAFEFIEELSVLM
ncbi:YwgA family protein [Planomicrobium sp. CPCC 101110]|uniref:YwgA family protein n=1 Tax=Planomicrobium sp. CPCC 101110 TaxID=2599619 RepID=UPI0011B5D290|nr:YwgA family protein [Planomicrobium sp. CPCC 101110]TWT27605.1 YwgA family protein [Planomicrobium sp. CPCC 101110]